MKKLFRSLIAVAAAAAAMTSCAKEMQENFSNTQQINVNFVAQDADTKTEFGTPEDGKVPVIWKEGDKVGLNVNLNGDMKVYAVDAVPTDGGKKAQFKYEGTLPAALTAPYTFYVISPNSGYVSSSPKNGYFQFLVPSKQTPTETSVDPAAQLLFAVSNNYEGIPTDVVNLQFEHLVAYGNLSVKNLDTEGKKVTGIDLIFETNVIGRYYIYPAKTGDERIEEVAGDKVVSLVTERLENNIFSVMPGDVSGKTLTVIVKVEGGAYKKQITIPADKAFKAGVISKFGVDLTGAEYEKEKTYSLVTDVATLKAGDQVIIGSSASLDTYGFVAMSTSQQQYNIAAVNVDNILKEKKLIAPGANIDVFTLEEGSAAGHFYMKSTNGKYLLRNPDSERAKNKNDLIARLKTDADYDDGCANWAFTLVNADTGELTIIANTNISSRKYIKANPNSGTLIFSCYSQASSMVAPCLYKLEDTPEPPKVPALERVWGFYKEGNTPWYATTNITAVSIAHPDGYGMARSLAMDDEYIYLPKSSGYANVAAVSISDKTVQKALNKTGVSGGSTFATSFVRMIKNTDATVNGGKDVLLLCNLSETKTDANQLRLYAYKDGVDAAPTQIAGFCWDGANNTNDYRRYGDRFFVTGDWTDGKVYFPSYHQPKTVVLSIANGARTSVTQINAGENSPNGIKDLTVYPGDNKLFLTNTAIANLVAPTGNKLNGWDEFTLSGSSANGVNTWGYNFFEFNGKKYIAYARIIGEKKAQIEVIEDKGDLLTSLEAKEGLLVSPIHDATDLNKEVATGNLADCCVRTINGVTYIAALTRDGGFVLDKLVLK